MKTLLNTLTESQARLDEERRTREAKIGVEFDLDDCFVSTWANDLNRSLRARQLEILNGSGTACFDVLVDPATGEEVPHKRVQTRYGTKAVTEDGRWIEIGGQRSAKNKGLQWEKRDCFAWAKIGGGGQGLAGASSCHVVIIRVENDPRACESEREIRFYRPF